MTNFVSVPGNEWFFNKKGQFLIYWCVPIVQASRIFTARKRSLRRLCFHRRLSVHSGGGSLSRGGPCPGGLCLGGLCQGNPPYGYVRVVHILLDCILVLHQPVGMYCVFYCCFWPSNFTITLLMVQLYFVAYCYFRFIFLGNFFHLDDKLAPTSFKIEKLKAWNESS